MGMNVSMRRGLIGAAATAGAVAVGLSSYGTAAADTFIKLPDGTESGAGLTISRTNETAQVSPSLAANGAGRVAWVSADITLNAPNLKPAPAGPNNGPAGDTSGGQSAPTGFSPINGSNNVSNDGAAATLNAGYIIGCQLNIAGLSGNISGSFQVLPTVTGTLTAPISAGQVAFYQIGYKDIAKAGTYHLNYDREQIQIQNCGGYAQARSYAVVETGGSDHAKVTLYGKPFSIG